jgi:hypothetical protein
MMLLLLLLLLLDAESRRPLQSEVLQRRSEDQEIPLHGCLLSVGLSSKVELASVNI